MVAMIIYAILIFCLLIFVHELGHFLTAKAVGIKVNEFALGMGPVLLHYKKGDTDYSLRAFPIGGFCKMEGEDEDSEDASAFNNKPLPAKALVVVAGSAMNLLLAILLTAIVIVAVGIPNTTIDTLTPDFPAMKAGLLPGDTIVQIDDKAIKTWDDITGNIEKGKGESLNIVVDRDGQRLSYNVNTVKSEDDRWIIGITSEREKSPGKSLVYATKNVFEVGKEMLLYVGRMFTGQESAKNLTGPVGIVYMVGETAKMGLLSLAQFTAFISLNLAIVNMLPFPALDGGRLLFMIIRIFTGKAISDETEGKIHFIGLMLLFGLMIYITFQDVLHLDRFKL